MKKDKKHYIQTTIVSVFFVAAFAFLVSGDSLTNYMGPSQKAAAGDFDWKTFYAVESFVVVDAGSNKEVRELKDGEVIDIKEFKDGFNILAKTTPSVLSVQFALDDNKDYRTDSWPQFAAYYELWGNYHKMPVELGEHTLSATPYSHRRAKGFAGNTKTYTWTLVDQSDPI